MCRGGMLLDKHQNKNKMTVIWDLLPVICYIDTEVSEEPGVSIFKFEKFGPLHKFSSVQRIVTRNLCSHGCKY